MPVAIPLIAAGVAAAGSMIAAKQQSDAVNNAANTQASVEQSAQEKQTEMFNQQQANQKPWIDAGKGALNQLTAGTSPGGKFATPVTVGGLSPDQAYAKYSQPFQFSTTGANADPSYQWRTQQGLKAINSGAAAQGNYFSGKTGLALQDYGQQSASQEYQAEFNRNMTQNQEGLNAYGAAYNADTAAQQQQYNQLSSLAGLGQTSSLNVGQWGMQSVNGSGSSKLDPSAQLAYAQGQVGAGLTQNLTNQFTSLAGQYADQWSTPTNYGGGSGTNYDPNYDPNNLALTRSGY